MEIYNDGEIYLKSKFKQKVESNCLHFACTEKFTSDEPILYVIVAEEEAFLLKLYIMRPIL